MRSYIIIGLMFAALGCDNMDRDDSNIASAATAAPTQQTAATTEPTGKASAAEVAKQPGIEVLGGGDWKAVFAGPSPLKLKESRGGGRATGMGSAHTRVAGKPYGQPGWKYNATNRGGMHKSASKKVLIVENYNIKRNPTKKTIDLWIKNALVKNVKHVGGPEVIEVGPKKALALAGAGTCTMKGGEEADFYWRDVHAVGDFSHNLSIVVVAKDASEDDKKVALSTLRQFEYTDNAKPHYTQ